jgi:hypothetical protein
MIKISTYYPCTSLLSIFENVLKLSHRNAEFKQFSGGNTSNPRFGGRDNVLKFSYNRLFPWITPVGPCFRGE